MIMSSVSVLFCVLKKNMWILEDKTGHKVSSYRAPGFSLTETIAVYSGPGYHYVIIEYLNPGDSVIISGAVYDCLWIQVYMIELDTTGWLPSEPLEYLQSRHSTALK